MASDWTPVGEFTERNGKAVAVEHKDGDVRAVIYAPGTRTVLTQLVMGGEHRDAFLQLFAAAEFAAEREAEPGTVGALSLHEGSA